MSKRMFALAGLSVVMFLINRGLSAQCDLEGAQYQARLILDKAAAEAPLQLSYKDRDKTYDLALGREVHISLRYNPKAGNTWAVLENGAPGLALSGVENAAQVQIFKFAAAAPGTFSVKLKYQGNNVPDYSFAAVFNIR